VAPFTAELPGADADDGDFQVGFAEGAVFHKCYLLYRSGLNHAIS
jgi:hypothetical protein